MSAIEQAIGVSSWIAAALAVIATVAATVNGALGYGFSSVTVPASLAFIPLRVLTPTLVVVEVMINATSLLLHRRDVKAVRPLTGQLLLGLAPGIGLGALAFSTIATTWLKTLTYIVLLPIIALQSFAIRWPALALPRASIGFGAGLGVLYATTTISGPPLALYFNNLGLAQNQFRAAMALVRVCESTLTLVIYIAIGALTTRNLLLGAWLVPFIVVGLTLGRWLIANVDRQRFAAICMRSDAALVTVGLTFAFIGHGWLTPWAAAIAAATLASVCFVWAKHRLIAKGVYG